MVARADWDGTSAICRKMFNCFAGTVAENIARLNEVDAEQVVAAARWAHAHEMILRLPFGYDTKLGPGGAGLSGGQRQWIALARVVYGRPRLVVLDEPDASLDGEGEEALRATLRALRTAGATVVVISHRNTLLPEMDALLLLKDGQPATVWSREEVPSGCGLGSGHAARDSGGKSIMTRDFQAMLNGYPIG